MPFITCLCVQLGLIALFENILTLHYSLEGINVGQSFYCNKIFLPMIKIGKMIRFGVIKRRGLERLGELENNILKFVIIISRGKGSGGF